MEGTGTELSLEKLVVIKWQIKQRRLLLLLSEQGRRDFNSSRLNYLSSGSFCLDLPGPHHADVFGCQQNTRFECPVAN